jgi:hypothetical protein
MHYPSSFQFKYIYTVEVYPRLSCSFLFENKREQSMLIVQKKWLRMPLFDFIFWFWVVGYSKGDVVLPW